MLFIRKTATTIGLWLLTSCNPPLTQHEHKADAYRLLAFVSASCPHCRLMEPLLSALKSGCARFVSVEHMSIAEPEVQQRAAQLGIWGVPTLVYINEQGQEKARIAGYKTGQELQHILHTASTSKQAVALKDCISWAAF